MNEKVVLIRVLLLSCSVVHSCCLFQVWEVSEDMLSAQNRKGVLISGTHAPLLRGALLGSLPGVGSV